MKNKEKILGILICICYILTNFLFYNVMYKDYVNRTVFFITASLFICEVAFWGYLITTLKDRDGILKSRLFQIAIPFLIGIIGTSIGRILLSSSLYLNDLLLTHTVFIYLIGIVRVIVIFFGISFITLAVEIKNPILVGIFIINLVTAIAIWLDFDGNLTSILRIITGVVAIAYFLFLKEKINYQEENNEKIPT